MKAYVASRFCKNLNEVKVAIFEYKRTLTPEKCARFISDLKKIIKISFFWIIRELFYYLGNTSCHSEKRWMVEKLTYSSV